MRPATLFATGASLAASSRAWQLPNNNNLMQQLLQRPLHTSAPAYDGDNDDIDIATDSQFRGLQTFANLPYVNALDDDEAEGHRYDIAVLGAPFDTATSGRPGARFGPGGIRIGSQRMFPGQVSVYTGEAALGGGGGGGGWARVVDCGDVGLTWFDNVVALRQLDKAHRVSRYLRQRRGRGRKAEGSQVLTYVKNIGHLEPSGCQLERVQDATDLDLGRGPYDDVECAEVDGGEMG